MFGGGGGAHASHSAPPSAGPPFLRGVPARGAVTKRSHLPPRAFQEGQGQPRSGPRPRTRAVPSRPSSCASSLRPQVVPSDEERGGGEAGEERGRVSVGLGTGCRSPTLLTPGPTPSTPANPRPHPLHSCFSRTPTLPSAPAPPGPPPSPPPPPLLTPGPTPPPLLLLDPQPPLLRNPYSSQTLHPPLRPHPCSSQTPTLSSAPTPAPSEPPLTLPFAPPLLLAHPHPPLRPHSCSSRTPTPPLCPYSSRTPTLHSAPTLLLSAPPLSPAPSAPNTCSFLDLYPPVPVPEPVSAPVWLFTAPRRLHCFPSPHLLVAPPSAPRPL